MDNSAVVSSSDPNLVLSKAEIERRRRARMNASLDQLKMFHLMKTPRPEAKLEKIEILDLTIKYLQSVGNEQTKEAEKFAYAGFRGGFQAAQKAAASFIYSSYHPAISSPLVASFNAELTSVFDQYFKSMNWIRPVHGVDIQRGEQLSLINNSQINWNQSERSSIIFQPQSHSTPIFHPHNIPPPLFESPESSYSSQSLSLSSVTTKVSSEDLDESSNDISSAQFICVTCEGNCRCTKK
uniref:BHLH domain-containing protein n=1 Tax=Setaria digitata TaxID=48799 RepID=A0A915PLA4_9BILA